MFCCVKCSYRTVTAWYNLFCFLFVSCGAISGVCGPQVKLEVGFQKDMLSLLGAMDGVVCAAGDTRGAGAGDPEGELPTRL